MNHNLAFDFSVDKENKTIKVKREFAAEHALVWDAYTKQELLDQWREMLLDVELAERVAHVLVERRERALLARALRFLAEQLLPVEGEMELVELARQHVGVTVDLVESQPVLPRL